MTPYEEVQDQDLQRHKLGIGDPTTPGRPEAFEHFGSGIYDQVSPSATTDCQQEQLQSGPIGGGHRHPNADTSGGSSKSTLGKIQRGHAGTNYTWQA